MNFGKILKSIGGPLLGVASAFIPGGPAVLKAINLVLPEDKKLPETATGSDMHQAVNNLTPEARSSLMEKELDVEIAEINSWTSIQEAHAIADASGSSWRPFIALMMAWFIVIASSFMVIIWVMAVHGNDVETLKVIKDSWPYLLALFGLPTELLRAYFGMRTKEKKARYSTAAGQPDGAVASFIKAKWGS